MSERVELVKVPFEEEDGVGESDARTDGAPIDMNDPRLTVEVTESDPEADAYAKFVTLKVRTDMRGLLARSIGVQW